MAASGRARRRPEPQYARASDPWTGTPWHALKLDRWEQAYHKRWEMVPQYGFAIPNNRALDVIASHPPVVEVGAGTGYWAHELRLRGVDVVAYDTHPGRGVNDYFGGRTRGEPLAGRWAGGVLWTEVIQGDARLVVKQHRDRSLLMCWPDYDDPWAVETLRAYKGDMLFYVGEGSGGCTGDDAFHSLLGRSWTEVDHIAIPQWPGIHDSLRVLTRKRKR